MRHLLFLPAAAHDWIRRVPGLCGATPPVLQEIRHENTGALTWAPRVPEHLWEATERRALVLVWDYTPSLEGVDRLLRAIHADHGDQHCPWLLMAKYTPAYVRNVADEAVRRGLGTIEVLGTAPSKKDPS